MIILSDTDEDNIDDNNDIIQMKPVVFATSSTTNTVNITAHNNTATTVNDNHRHHQHNNQHQHQMMEVTNIPTKDEIELQIRKEKYYASLNKQAKYKKNSRTMLLTTLRQKVHQIAIDNYCNMKKITNENELKLQLQISENCRSAVTKLFVIFFIEPVINIIYPFLYSILCIHNNNHVYKL